MGKEISFFVPFHNEEATLAETVAVISEVASEALTDYEIILVDDHSSDRSPEIARALCDSRVKYLKSELGRGFGAAYTTGLRHAQKKHVMYLTADGDVNRRELSQLLNFWNGNSLLIQFCRNDSCRSLHRLFLSRTYTKTVQMLSGTRHPYYNGFNILPNKKSDAHLIRDFSFCTQAATLIRFSKGEEVQTVGTDCIYHDEASKALTLKNIKTAFRFFASLGFNR